MNACVSLPCYCLQLVAFNFQYSNFEFAKELVVFRIFTNREKKKTAPYIFERLNMLICKKCANNEKKRRCNDTCRLKNMSTWDYAMSMAIKCVIPLSWAFFCYLIKWVEVKSGINTCYISNNLLHWYFHLQDGNYAEVYRMTQFNSYECKMEKNSSWIYHWQSHIKVRYWNNR